MSSPTRPKHIVIVGAGPSGLLLALLLARHGIPVTVLEAASQLDTQPRAAHYGPPCIPDLFRAGLLPEIKSRGLTLNTMCWRKLDGTVIAGLDASVLVDEDGRGNIEELDDDGMEGLDCRTVSLPLQDLLRLMYERLQTFPHATVLFEHKVVEIGEKTGVASTAACVVAELRSADGPVQKKSFKGDYVVGCDGANSAVRKLLLGDGEKGLPGYTWEQRQIVATNVSHPFAVHATPLLRYTFPAKQAFGPSQSLHFPCHCQCSLTDYHRHTTLSKITTTSTQTSSFIHNTSTWPQSSLQALQILQAKTAHSGV